MNWWTLWSLSCSQSYGTPSQQDHRAVCAQALVSCLGVLVHSGTLPCWRQWRSDWSHCTSALLLLAFVSLALQNTLKMSGLPLTPLLGAYQCGVLCQQCTASFVLKFKHASWSRVKDKCTSIVMLPYLTLPSGRHSHLCWSTLGYTSATLRL